MQNEQNIDQIMIQQLCETSSIINTKQNYTSLINFFPKPINSLKLQFKASNFQFSLKSYYQKCGHLTNTIIICLNQNNKIIGGYTPLNFNPQPISNNFVSDQSMSSFVFSLTTNEKFPIKMKQNAIFHHQIKNYISFGNFLFIGDHANIEINSALYFNSNNYDTLNYNNDKHSNFKVIGHQGWGFFVKEWEVICVQFKL